MTADRTQARARPLALTQIALRESRPSPEGWFRLLSSSALRDGHVRVVRAAGRDLVVFRTVAGTLGVLDAYCPHLGAHLGYGGSVRGESLRCPFHGLRFAPDGSCVGHEQARDFSPRVRIAAWPALEWEGQVMVFLSEDGRAADWELPRLDSAHLTALHWAEVELDGHVQDIAENGVDVGHFHALHAYFDLGQPEIRFERHRVYSKFGFSRRSPLLPSVLGSIRNVFDTEIHGLGCSITNLTVQDWHLRAQLLVMPRQLDAHRVCFAVGVRLAVGAKLARLDRALGGRMSRPAAQLLLKHILHDALQDQAIWQHRVPLSRPALLPGDAALGEFRRYARQFYPRAPND